MKLSSYPHLVKEWHPTKNGELTPNDFTHGSDKKDSIRQELEEQEQQRPLVKDQINYKGLREPITGNELIKRTQEGINKYKQYNKRRDEWRVSRGYF